MATKTSLSIPRRRLVELMQEINFGRIENLAVLNGEPVFDPPPHVTQDIKLDGENGPRPELKTQDFELKSKVVSLFKVLDTLGNATIRSLECKHGLPFIMRVEKRIGLKTQ